MRKLSKAALAKALIAGFSVMLSGLSAFADETSAQIESRLSLIYREAVLNESVGQVDQEHANLVKITESGPKDSKYVAMAIQKLCHSDKTYCRAEAFTSDAGTSAQKKKIAEIRRLLKEVDGLEISVINNHIVIDGETATVRDFDRVSSVRALYPLNEVVSLVRISPTLQKSVAQMIYNDINLPEVEVRTVDQTVILQGTVEDKLMSDRCEVIAQMYAKSLPGKALVLNLLFLNAKRGVASRQ